MSGRRLCCLERRTAGAPDYTETTVMPALGDTPTPARRLADGAPVDQLEALPAGVLEAALAPASTAKGRAAYRLPVPRRPWRRVLCWVSLGHFWFPGVPACLDCGKRYPALERFGRR